MGGHVNDSSPRLLQLCILHFYFNDAIISILGDSHCCSPIIKRPWSQRSHHADTATITLASIYLHFGTSQAKHPWLRHAVLPIPDNSDRPSDETNFSVFRTNRRIKSRAFSVSWPKNWSLRTSVRQCTSVALFKSKLKTHVLTMSYCPMASNVVSRALVGY